MYKTFLKESNYVPASQGVPQEDLKNTWVRTKDYPSSTLDSEQLKMPDANQRKVVGWFATKYNMAYGWVIQEASDLDKKEFGKDVFRIYSDKGTSIAKFDLKKGKVYYLDNEAYEEGKIKFERPFMYDRLLIDNNKKAFKAFGIV